jgi:hypothetical protein
MRARVEIQAGDASRASPATRNVVYSVLSGVAALTSSGIWLLMVVDEQRSFGAATLEMVVKFTNLTVLLVGVVAAWIAFGGSPGTARSVAHLSVMAMAVVTAVVNATLLDPALPRGWWGVVDLSQHYLIPVAVVAAWATWGPPVDVARSHVARIVVVPLVWLVFVLVRGAVTASYPYDFVDANQNGWARVVATVAAIVVVMVAVGGGFATIDRRRHRPHGRA